MKQRQDREGRQIALDVMAASIAHEINQPLGAMVTNANAALRWMANATPDLDEARAALTRMNANVTAWVPPYGRKQPAHAESLRHP
jgi:C4-dicarboxylate-specific signal transduction histidine kinase